MQTRRIVGFFLRFLIVYAVLMALWPAVGDVYGSLFRTGGKSLFGPFPSSGQVRFEHLPDAEGMNDTRIWVRRPGLRKWRRFRVSSRHMGYLSTALLTGLLVATPLPWRRRTRAIIWGLLVVHVFIALRQGIVVAYGLHLNTGVPQMLRDPYWSNPLRIGVEFLAGGPGSSCIAAILIWILVSLRREDLAMILPAHRDRAAKPRTGGTVKRRGAPCLRSNGGGGID